MTYDTRDVDLDARSGVFVEGELFPFYEADNNEFALRTTLEGRTYFTPASLGDVTLAGRARIGSITGITIPDAPPQLLFFSGGGGSVRGFSFLSNGVTLDNGDIVGGRSLLEFSGEVRTRISETIGIVGFLDAGLVGADTLPDFEEEFEVGIGAGLRIATGLGPLRFDVARGLDLEDDDPEITFFIGIGQSF